MSPNKFVILSEAKDLCNRRALLTRRTITHQDSNPPPHALYFRRR
jgi:hypothetical protein